MCNQNNIIIIEALIHGHCAIDLVEGLKQAITVRLEWNKTAAQKSFNLEASLNLILYQFW